MKWVHLSLGIFWILMVIPTVLIWKDSILLVLLMSLYANIESSLAAFEASRKKTNVESPGGK
jgi:hypothetical protein